MEFFFGPYYIRGFLVAVLAVAFPYFLAKRLQSKDSSLGGAWSWRRSERMPAELRDAEIFMNEETVSMTDPVPFHGRVDQVFLTRSGTLVLLDTKYRLSGQVHGDDIVQLSCYAFALRKSCGTPVAKHAYLRMVQDEDGSRTVSYVKVDLKSNRWVWRFLLMQ